MNRIKAYLRRHHLAMLALFIAMGGTSYAATALPRNSVDARQIRAGAVGSSEIRANAVGTSEIKARAVGSSEVRDGTLLAKDFKTGELPRGAAGATGATGPAGPTGASNTDPLPAVRVRKTSDTQIIPSSTSTMLGGAPSTTTVRFSDATSEQYDIGDFFDPATVTNPPAGQPADGDAVLTIPRTGTYQVTAQVRWAANATGSRSVFLSGPQPGGVRASSTVPANSDANDTTRQGLATAERFAAGDRIFISVAQSSGGPLALDASQNQIHLSATFVGP